MDYANPKLRCLLIVTGMLTVCGSTGCGKRTEAIDENQLAQLRQWEKVERAKVPPPVPTGTRELFSEPVGAISEFMISSGRTKLLVVGTDPMDASALPRSKVFVVDLDEAKVLSRYDLHLLRTAFSPDERRLAAIGHVASPVELGSSSSGEQRPASLLQNFNDAQRSWKWTYDVRVADVATGQWRVVVGQSPAAIQAIGWNEDGRELITVNKARYTQSETEFAEARKQNPNLLMDLAGAPQIAFSFWNSETGEPVKTVSGPKLNYDSAMLSDNGRLVALWNSKGTNDIVICDPSSGAELYRLDGHRRAYVELAFSPKGRYLACRETFEKNSDTRIVIWDIQSGRRLSEFDSQAMRLAFSPDEQRLATANAALDENGELAWSVSLRDVASGVELKTLEPMGRDVRVAFLSNSELITTSTFNTIASKSHILVWDIVNYD